MRKPLVELNASNIRRDRKAAAWLKKHIMPLYPDIAYELLSARKRLGKLTVVLCFCTLPIFIIGMVSMMSVFLHNDYPVKRYGHVEGDTAWYIQNDKKTINLADWDCLTNDDEVILYFDHEDNLIKVVSSMAEEHYANTHIGFGFLMVIAWVAVWIILEFIFAHKYCWEWRIYNSWFQRTRTPEIEDFMDTWIAYKERNGCR